MINETKPARPVSNTHADKNLTKLGISLAVFLTLMQVSALILSLLIKAVAKGGILTDSSFLTILLSLVSTDIIAVPVFWLLVRKLPKEKMHEEKCSAGLFIRCLLIMFFFEYVGSLIGKGVQLLLHVDQGAIVSDIIRGSAGILTLIYVGVVGPIFEEMVFRKWVMERTVGRGRWFAILLSGFTFAMFHCNISQFFYTFLIGCLFAYVYEHTGKIQASIALHMIMNLTSLGLSKILDSLGDDEKSILITAAVAMIMFCLYLAGGIIFFIRLRRIKVKENEGAPSIAKSIVALFGNAGLWIFYAISIAFLIFSIAMTIKKAKSDVISKQTELTITIADGEIDRKTLAFDLEVKDEEDYTICFDWNCSDEKIPSFITGARVIDAGGEVVAVITADITSATISDNYLEPGKYTVEYTFITSKEECLEYLDNNGNKVEDPDSFTVSDVLGEDGEFDMTYEVRLEK